VKVPSACKKPLQVDQALGPLDRLAGVQVEPEDELAVAHPARQVVLPTLGPSVNSRRNTAVPSKLVGPVMVS
jgi:hypothetical protein